MDKKLFITFEKRLIQDEKSMKDFLKLINDKTKTELKVELMDFGKHGTYKNEHEVPTNFGFVFAEDGNVLFSQTKFPIPYLLCYETKENLLPTHPNGFRDEIDFDNINQAIVTEPIRLKRTFDN